MDSLMKQANDAAMRGSLNAKMDRLKESMANEDPRLAALIGFTAGYNYCWDLMAEHGLVPTRHESFEMFAPTGKKIGDTLHLRLPSNQEGGDDETAE